MKKIFKIIQHYGFSIIPTFTILVSILFTIMPYQVSNVSLLMPLIVHITLYFWTVYRPQTVPYVIVLILGMLKDIIESNILGLNVLYFLLFQIIIKSQRKYIYNNVFIVVWAGFMFCLSLILLLPLLLSKFDVNIKHYSLSIVFIQWLITIFAYVPIHWLLSKLNNEQ